MLAAGVRPGHLCGYPALGPQGCRGDRPGLADSPRAPVEGGAPVVWRLDRPGRDPCRLANAVYDLTRRGVGRRVLAGQAAQVDAATAQGKLVTGIFAHRAEFGVTCRTPYRHVGSEGELSPDGQKLLECRGEAVA